MAPPKPPKGVREARVDAWTLRCLFNRGRYSALIASGELTPLHMRQSQVRPDGSKTVQVYYGYAATTFLTVRLQWVEDSNGRILGSGLKDPKHLYIQEHGIDYHQHEGDRWWQRARREPERLLPTLSLKLAYGVWRTYKCRVLGPVEAYRLRFRLWALG